MTDYAEPLTIPRPKTRLLDKIIAWVNTLTTWLIALALGFCIGALQGAAQSDAHWVDKIVTRATAELETGDAKAIHEEAPYVYYSRREKRP